MIFSSPIFLFMFFPLFFCSLYLSLKNIRIQNTIIILGSIFFYAWGARNFIFIVISTLFLDYFLGKLLYTKPRYARLCIAADVIVNVGILLYFKYCNFFVDNINIVLQGMGIHPFTLSHIVLPIGVSFVVFQKMTYCLDIARGTAKPAENFFCLLEYLLIFPQIIAGPIVKYGEIADQITRRSLTWDTFLYGFKRFAVGLFKKVWIADVLAKYADTVFAAFSLADKLPFDYAWFGILTYTFQIFFDFSAYSDMAIGMLAMMGFRIGENFNTPYISSSITEFWKRWHISMTSWFREYVYFSIGGNRKGAIRTYVNQWIVFLVSGFWHGAAWNFIFWGAYHGTLLCAERAFLLQVTRNVHRVARWGATFLLVMLGWVFFRVHSVRAGFSYIINMFDFSSYYTHVDPASILVVDARGQCVFILAALMCFVPFFFEKQYQAGCAFMQNRSGIAAVAALCLFAFSALKVIAGSASPFIYFKF